MFYDLFCCYYGSCNGDIFPVSRKTYTDIFNRIFNCGDWKICVSCDIYQFCFCGTYNCYNFLLTGNCAYKIKSFYHCTSSNCSSCSIGVGISFYRFRCSVVDISRYRDYCKYDRHIDNRDSKGQILFTGASLMEIMARQR